MMVCLISLSSLPILALDDGGAGRGQKIDRDTAATIAMLVVAGSVDAQTSNCWTEKTTIQDIVNLFNNDETMSGYCIMLETDNAPTGYVIVSAYSGTTLVPEFSDEQTPMFLLSAQTNMRAGQENKIYYTAPLTYYVNRQLVQDSTLNLLDQIEVDSFAYSMETEESNQSVLNLIEWAEPISAQDWIDKVDRSITARGNNRGEWISDPVQYLRNVYGVVYSNWYYNNALQGKVYNYLVSGEEACSVNAIAAMIHLNRAKISSSISGSSFNTIFTNTRRVGIDSGLYRPNYGVEFWDIASLANKAIKDMAPNSSWSASTKYFPLMWSTCETEINAGRAVCINIARGYYSNHSVTGYAYTMFQNPAGDLQEFIKVEDGWNPGVTRYVHCSDNDIASVTIIRP